MAKDLVIDGVTYNSVSSVEIPTTDGDTATFLDEDEIPEGDTPSGDYIPVPATAEVGQTIRVSAVDENGKPTAWEAVDLASGDEWRKICTVTLTEAVTPITIDKDDNGNSFACKKIMIFGSFCHDLDNSVKAFHISTYLHSSVGGYPKLVHALQGAFDTGRSQGTKIWLDTTTPYLTVRCTYIRNNSNVSPVALYETTFYSGKIELTDIKNLTLAMVDSAYPFNTDTVFEVWGVDA